MKLVPWYDDNEFLTMSIDLADLRSSLDLCPAGLTEQWGQSCLGSAQHKAYQGMANALASQRLKEPEKYIKPIPPVQWGKLVPIDYDWEEVFDLNPNFFV